TELYHDIQSFLIEEGIADMVEAVLEERGVIIRFRDSVLFDTGRADIRPDGARIIDTIATYLVRIPNHVRIEGHADNVPIRNARYPSNWELSTARATSVIRYLLTKTDISPERLSAAGYGEYRPVAPNDTPENRARNRRVDLVLLRLDLNALEPN
ncbi:MAG: OmpA family protein, partial [Firmicutes bacterium]|nr:OmpA family protein [Bacillota bacterium]